VPPQWATKVMNRATADNQTTQAEEEGLEPTKEWVKDLVDEIIAEEFASPDLELAWLDEDEGDPKGLEAVLEGRVKLGAVTLNEMRDALGLDPFDNAAADRPMVLTATGYVPIEANAGAEEANAQSANGQAAPAVKKYNRDQPRVPAGNPEGGQWTSGDDTGSSDSTDNSDAIIGEISNPGTRYAALETGTQTDATDDMSSNSQTHDDSVEPQIAQANDGSLQRKPIDLRDEEAPVGIGHAIRDHVGKTDAELMQQMIAKTLRSPFVSLVDRREGSFDSIEIANDFANHALDAPENAARIAEVASGQAWWPRLITLSIGSVTGRELYRSAPDSEPYMRDTDGVGVLIVHDPRKPRGYSIITAYPRSD